MWSGASIGFSAADRSPRPAGYVDLRAFVFMIVLIMRKLFSILFVSLFIMPVSVARAQVSFDVHIGPPRYR